jgi:hypothetical protein
MKSIFTIKITFLVIVFLILSQKLFAQKNASKNTYYELLENNKLERITKITNGNHTFYNANNQMLIEGVFKNGLLVDGQIFIRDQNGFLSSIESYKKGKFIGYVHAIEIKEQTKDSLSSNPK